MCRLAHISTYFEPEVSHLYLHLHKCRENPSVPIRLPGKMHASLGQDAAEPVGPTAVGQVFLVQSFQPHR